MNAGISPEADPPFRRLCGIVYDLTCVAVAVPLAFVIRTGTLAPLDQANTVFCVSFIMFAAAGLSHLELHARTAVPRSLADSLAKLALCIVGGMAAALIVTFVLSRLEGVPRSIPVIAIVVAVGLAMLPRLLSKGMNALDKMRIGAPQDGSLIHSPAEAPVRIVNAGSARLTAPPTGTQISVKQWTDIIIVFCLPTAIGMTMLGPQGMAWFGIILAVIMFAVLLPEMKRKGRGDILLSIWPFLAAATLLVAWAAARTIATGSSAAAFPILATFALALLSAVVSGVAAYKIEPGPRWFWIFFPIVQVVASALLVLALMVVSQTRSPSLPGGRLDYYYHYNRLALFVVLLYPLTAYAIQQMKMSRWAVLMTHAGVAALVLLGTFLSASESAMLAIVAMGLVYLLSCVSVGWTRRVVTAVCVGLVLLAPFVFQAVFLVLKDSALWTFRPGTFATRVMIWEGALSLIKQAPVVGNGVEVIRFAGVPDPSTNVMQMHHHPHSFLLQTWVDLGLVGAALMAACILAAARLIRPVRPDAARMFLCILTGILSIWAVSHGMWQAWYVGLSGTVLAFAILAYRRSLSAP